MKQWNGFLAILFYMGLCQIIYDVTFYLSYDTNFGETATTFFGFFQAFGGLSVGFWTNALSLVVFHVVYNRSRFNILKYFWLISIGVLLPTCVISGVELACGLAHREHCKYIMTEIYYWVRIGTIALNFIVFGMLYVMIRRMRDKKRTPTEAEVSMVVLSRRMIYYPFVQFFSRVFNACYEELYGFGAYQGETSPPLESRQQFIMQCLACMTQPSAGIGFLIIFLIFQPHAKEHLIALLTKCNTKEVAKTVPTLSDTTEPTPSCHDNNNNNSIGEANAHPNNRQTTQGGRETTVADMSFHPSNFNLLSEGLLGTKYENMKAIYWC